MTKKTLITVLTLTMSFNAFSEDLWEAIERAKQNGSAERARILNEQRDRANPNALSDEDMRNIGGPIIADGVYSEEVERILIIQFKEGNAEAAKTIQQINKVITAARTGKLTEHAVGKEFDRFLMGLHKMGIPDSVLNAQLEVLIRAQEAAAREAAEQARRQAIFNGLVSDLIDFGNQYRNQAQNEQMVMDFGNLLNNYLQMGSNL